MTIFTVGKGEVLLWLLYVRDNKDGVVKVYGFPNPDEVAANMARLSAGFDVSFTITECAVPAFNALEVHDLEYSH